MDIVRSLMRIGAEAGGVKQLNPSTPITIGFEIIEKASKSVSFLKPGDSLAIILVCLIILLCLAAVAANVLMVLVTAWIMAYAGMFVLGFGGSRWTSDIAIGYFRAVAGIAMKLLAMTLMIGIATSVMSNLLAKIDDGASVEQLLVPCVVAFVLAMLIHTLPNIVAGLIPGGGGAASATGSFSAGAVAGAGMQAARTATSMAGSAMSGGLSMMSGMAGGVASGAKSMYSAFTGMQSGGSSGLGMVTQMASMLGGGGGGGGSGGSGGASSPLGGAMGLATAASGGIGGGSLASAASSLASAGGQESGGSATQQAVQQTAGLAAVALAASRADRTRVVLAAVLAVVRVKARTAVVLGAAAPEAVLLPWRKQPAPMAQAVRHQPLARALAPMFKPQRTALAHAARRPGQVLLAVPPALPLRLAGVRA